MDIQSESRKEKRRRCRLEVIRRKEHKERKKESSFKNIQEEDMDETEQVYDVEGGIEFHEIPEGPETSTPETMGVPSEHVDPFVKRKRRNRRKNKDKKKTRICTPEEAAELLKRLPRHAIVGPVVIKCIEVYLDSFIALQSHNALSDPLFASFLSVHSSKKKNYIQ